MGAYHSCIKREFSHTNLDKCEFLSLENKILTAYVCDVYDGDTITIITHLHDIYTGRKKMYKWKCRLADIDTPEIRTKNKKEKQFGIIVRDKLKALCLYKNIIVKCGKFDKYGRLLIWILSKNMVKKEDKDLFKNIDKHKYINHWFIQEGYAKSYNGGIKEKFV